MRRAEQQPRNHTHTRQLGSWPYMRESSPLALFRRYTPRPPRWRAFGGVPGSRVVGLHPRAWAFERAPRAVRLPRALGVLLSDEVLHSEHLNLSALARHSARRGRVAWAQQANPNPRLGAGTGVPEFLRWRSPGAAPPSLATDRARACLRSPGRLAAGRRGRSRRPRGAARAPRPAADRSALAVSAGCCTAPSSPARRTPTRRCRRRPLLLPLATPLGVPSRCASAADTVDGCTPASSRPRRQTSACPGSWDIGRSRRACSPRMHHSAARGPP